MNISLRGINTGVFKKIQPSTKQFHHAPEVPGPLSQLVPIGLERSPG